MTKRSVTIEDADVYPEMFVRLVPSTVVLILLCVSLSHLHPGVHFVAALIGQLAVVPVWAVLARRADAARCITGFYLCFAGLAVGFQRLTLERPQAAIGGGLLVGTFFLILLPLAFRIVGLVVERVPTEALTLRGMLQISIRQIFGLTTLAALTIYVALSEIAVELFTGHWTMGLVTFLPGIPAGTILGLKSLRVVFAILTILVLVIPWSMEVNAWASMLCYFAGVAIPLFIFRSLGFRLIKIPHRTNRLTSTETASISQHDHA